MELSFCVCRMKIYFNCNSQGSEKIKFFSQEIYGLSILGNVTFIITGYKDIKQGGHCPGNQEKVRENEKGKF